MNFIADIDQKNIAEIFGIQGELLRETVTYLSKNSPFYIERLKTQPDIKGIEDIARLPITTKEDIQKDNWGFLCVEKDKLAEIVATTGTTGVHVFIGLTKKDRDRLAENERRCFSYADVAPQDLFLLSVTMDNLFIAGMAYYSGLQRLGAGVVRVGPHSPKRQLELIQTIHPTGIVAVPSFLNSIYKQAEKDGIKLYSTTLKKAVLIGESIRNPDFSSNTLGKMVERIGSVECFSTYGITEAQAAFCECPHHKGLHSHPDLVYAEILDDAGNPVRDGEIGELVVTTFQVEGMPLLRYRTGDITFKITGKCDCGRTSVRIGPVIGRKAQKLKVKGTTVYPKAIENALLEIEGVENYVIEAYTGDDQADHVVVKIGTHYGNTSFKDTVCENIKAKVRFKPQVEIMLPQEVEKILYEGGRRKPMTFVDNRHKGLHDAQL
ncbi:MAG: AMP-binding protein [Deltaproteobacteria bacterium]|nr:AMP-binding protein [Deltaproteobacteria bacterium]